MLTVGNLHASIGGKKVLNGVDMIIRPGEIHALMGPNGSGKSTFANVLMGHPAYEVTDGDIAFLGHNLLEMAPNERSLAGLFLAFQYPVEIPGITVGKYLKRAAELRNPGGVMNVSAFIRELRELLSFLGMDRNFINRYLNEGFSGGEKKRMEVLQMLALKPKLALLDETDSGLDIDALKMVAGGVNRLAGGTDRLDGGTDRLVGGDFSALVITHYQRILDYIGPDVVHVMFRGRIVLSGGAEIVRDLEKRGYDWIREEFGEETDTDEPAEEVGA